ncbi:hypothetical protein HPB51_013155 [Rhipicephalus microplus]|uniref:Uncharacterized protein n=1 Tax=Rhipicephalus microplus TaxID=6941 RepID=A0A9J6E1E2_RHIMP|nr:hypothetical protein HPB51_013155 [Rhipicephalus microplus]
MAAGPAPSAAAAKKPVLVELDIDFSDGGSSPWFNSKGRSIVGDLTNVPENAELFSELALDGTIAGLTGYLDSKQPTLGHVALFCYILLGLVLLELLVALPLCAFTLRRYVSGVGILPWLACEFVFLGCAGVQVVSLLSMFSTWNGMRDGLDDKAPEAYTWTFQLLLNYTQLTALQIKEAKDPLSKDIDKALTLTTNSIKWLQGNLSAWETSFSGYENLKGMVTGPLAIVHMVLLGIALVVAVSAALFACGAWSRRKRNLKAGGKSPVFVGFMLLGGTVLLLVHLLVALPMVARWLNVCVLAETYLCAPYRGGSYAILDDGAARVWPLANRPEPFCRLVPSAVRPKCAVKATTPITALKVCPAVKKGKAQQSDISITESQLLLWQKPQKPKKPKRAKKLIGDCFYPSFAAGAITVIFLAVGEKKKKVVKKILRRKRTKRKKKKKKPKEPSTPPPPPPTPPAPAPPSPPPPPEPQHIEVAIPVPTPVMGRPRHRRRRRQPLMPPPIFVLPPPPLPHVHCTHLLRPRTAQPMLAAPMLPPAAASAPASSSTVVMSPSRSLYQQQEAASYSNVNLYRGGAGTWQEYSAYNSSASSTTVTPAVTLRRTPSQRVETVYLKGSQPVLTRYRTHNPQLQPTT